MGMNAAIKDDHRRGTALLEQKVQALETELLECKKVLQTLQSREQELKDFLHNAVLGIHWVAADGTILWANKAELNLLGYSSEEYIGHHIAEFHADKPVIEDILQRLTCGEELRGYEARLKCKDGSLRHVRIDSNVFKRNGEFIHTLCLTTDVTDTKQIDQASLRLAAIVESSDDAIASKDLNGVITSWNLAAERIFGYKAAEIIGRPVLLLIPPELHPDEDVILGKIRKGERIEHFETVRVTKSGERLDVSLTVSPIKDPQGKIIGAAKIVRDITQQKKLVTALHTSERLASVGRLAATVAHEINNPLEAVTNFIYLAKLNPDLPEKVRRDLNSADRELARVAHIAQQTLGFYRDGSSPVKFKVADAIADVLTIYERKLQYKNLILEKQVQSGLTIYAWQGEVKQMLSNLISNAIDACGEGGRIVIRANSFDHVQCGRAGIRITVADNGSGIPEEEKRKLFTPFFTTKKDVGTGLGLWITKDLLERKGGSIRFRSNNQVRQGTVMSIFLPQQVSTKVDGAIS